MLVKIGSGVYVVSEQVVAVSGFDPKQPVEVLLAGEIGTGGSTVKTDWTVDQVVLALKTAS